MMRDNRTRNRALVRYLLLPTIFLTVALTGGLRVSGETGAFLFIAPPLITLVLSVLLMLLFMRGRSLEIHRWLAAEHHPLTNIAHALTLLTLFFASAQSFNSVLPEAGLLRWMLSFFFLWTLWQNQFASFDARRLLRSLAALFGTAFVLKHLLLASLNSPGDSWTGRLTSALFEGVTLGALSAPPFAPATGYISFFTLALYVCGLILLPAAPDEEENAKPPTRELIKSYRQLSGDEQRRVREALQEEARGEITTNARDAHRLSGADDAIDAEAIDVDDGDEKTLLKKS